MAEITYKFKSEFIVSILNNLREKGISLSEFKYSENGEWTYTAPESVRDDFIGLQADAYQREWYKGECATIKEKVKESLEELLKKGVNNETILEQFIEQMNIKSKKRWSYENLTEENKAYLINMLNTLSTDNISEITDNLVLFLLEKNIIQRVKNSENIIVPDNNVLNPDNAKENVASSVVVWESMILFKAFGINFENFELGNYKISEIINIIVHAEWAKRNDYSDLSRVPLSLLSLVDAHKDLVAVFEATNKITKSGSNAEFIKGISDEFNENMSPFLQILEYLKTSLTNIADAASLETNPDIIRGKLNQVISNIPSSDAYYKTQAAFTTAIAVITNDGVSEDIKEFLVPLKESQKNDEAIDSTYDNVHKLETEFIYRIHKQDTIQFLEHLNSMLENNPKNEKARSYFKQIISFSLLEKDNLEDLKFITDLVSSSDALSDDEKRILLDIVMDKTSTIEQSTQQTIPNVNAKKSIVDMSEEEFEAYARMEAINRMH